MPDGFTSELRLARARPDLEQLVSDLAVYQAQFSTGGEWPEDDSLCTKLLRVMDAAVDDPERALAYLALTAAATDDVAWLGFMAAGTLEDMLRDPSEATLQRVLTESRRTPRFRWMLSRVYLHAIAARCREPVAHAVGGGAMDDASLPPRPWA